MSEIVKVGNAEVDKANYDYFSLLYFKMPKEYVVADLVSKCEDYNRLFSSYQDLEGKLQQKENIIKEVREYINEDKKIPEKLEILNANEHSKKVYYENYSKEEISLDIETLQIWVNEIIDYLKSKGE